MTLAWSYLICTVIASVAVVVAAWLIARRPPNQVTEHTTNHSQAIPVDELFRIAEGMAKKWGDVV
jgi:hypothetical protein